MEKRIAVLLHGSIKNDYRVLKTITTLSKKYLIDVYYISISETRLIPANGNIKYLPIDKKNGLKYKLLRHTLFCIEYNYMLKEVFNSGTVYDYVWANDLPTLIPAFRLAKKNNSKLIYDSHEIYTETINQFFPRELKGFKGIIFNFLIRVMRWHGVKIESKYIPKVNHFVTVNNSLLNYFENRYSVKKSSVIMNFPRLEDNKETKELDFRKKFSWNDSTKILLYQGALNEGRGLKLIIKTMASLDNQFRLIIIGGGPLKKELINLIEKLNLKRRVKFIDFINLTELPIYTRGVDIGVNLLETINLSKKMASPNKLFEYIHAGIPVISTDTFESRKVHSKFRVGILVKNNPVAIKNAVLKLSGDIEVEKLKFNFDKAKAYFSWEKQEDILKEIFE